LKGIAYTDAFHHLRRNEHNAPEYLALNPQGLLPTLETPKGVLTQSLAICEYLNETYPEPPLLPDEPLERAKARAFAQVIACDVHPLQNLKILARLRALGIDDEGVNEWARATITEGLDACATLIADRAARYCYGATPGLADICLVPQLVNARRFGVKSISPRLLAIEESCMALKEFATAAPDKQPDAER
jgi:maleylpyruvate isomerase